MTIMSIIILYEYNQHNIAIISITKNFFGGELVAQLS